MAAESVFFARQLEAVDNGKYAVNRGGTVPTLRGANKLKQILGAAQSSDARSLVRKMRRDAGFSEEDHPRDEKGQFSSAGAAASAARTAAKNAQTHATAMKAVAKRTGNAVHASQAEAADRRAKGARAAARKAEAATTAEEASKHFQRAHEHEVANRQSSQDLHAAEAIPKSEQREERRQMQYEATGKNPAEKLTPGLRAAGASEYARQTSKQAASRNTPEAHYVASSAHNKAADMQAAMGNRQAANEHYRAKAEHEEKARALTPKIEPTKSQLKGASLQASQTAREATSHARNERTYTAHQAAAGAHDKAAQAAQRAGDKGMAQHHEEQMGKHEAMAKELKKPEHEKTFRKSVDDYEHSGDTEREADELHEHGARNVQSHDGHDEDGERTGYNTYQLPKGVSHKQFQAGLDTSMHAEGYRHEGIASGFKSNVASHLKEMKYALKTGHGGEAMKSAAKVHEELAEGHEHAAAGIRIGAGDRPGSYGHISASEHEAHAKKLRAQASEIRELK